MPIYEFYCPDCNVIFNFYSRRVDTDRQPDCPRCSRPALDRKPSRFACSRGLKEEDESPLPGMDESRMEQAMMELAGEAENLNEDDPRQMARLMKRMYETTGMEMTPGIEEAIKRLEKGEDPEALEEELGDVLENDDPASEAGLFAGVRRRIRAGRRPPVVDETLYEL